MRLKLLTISVSLFCLFACNPGNGSHDHKGKHHGEHEKSHHGKKGHGGAHDSPNANHHMNKTSFEELVQRFEDPERESYQKPDEVIALLGDLNGKTVMDIGAGTGYFSFRLIDAGANVIAADVDDRFLDYVKNKGAELSLTSNQLSTRKVPYDSPALKKGEVDKVLIVNTYHHIENRVAYFKEVFEGLKDDGELVVVDFFKRDTKHGPPLKHKTSKEEVHRELAASGFKNFELRAEFLEDQYIMRAFKQ